MYIHNYICICLYIYIKIYKYTMYIYLFITRWLFSRREMRLILA